MMKKIWILLAVASCGKMDQSQAPDAAITIDCNNYCMAVQKNCTGANAQYATPDQCMTSCKSFDVGVAGAGSGNTLGCRFHYALVAEKTPTAAGCAFAGPAGDQINATAPAGCSNAGDFCTSFCKLEVQACGSLQSPLTGNPRDVDGNPLYQYRNVDDCIQTCADYDKAHPYIVNSPSSSGDSLACRLLAATMAAASSEAATASCASTAVNPRGQCAGTASP